MSPKPIAPLNFPKHARNIANGIRSPRRLANRRQLPELLLFSHAMSVQQLRLCSVSALVWPVNIQEQSWHYDRAAGAGGDD